MVPLDPTVFQIGTTNRGYEIVKNNIVVVTFLTLFVLVTFHFYKSSLGQTRRYSIRRTRTSILTLRQHTAYTFLILFSLLIDRASSNMIKIFYMDLGPHKGFFAFWFKEVTFFFLVHLLSPILIYLDASQKLELFNGLRGKKFPGQYDLRKLEIVPRRDFCPEYIDTSSNKEGEERFKRKRKAKKDHQNCEDYHKKFRLGHQMFKTEKNVADLRIDDKDQMAYLTKKIDTLEINEMEDQYNLKTSPLYTVTLELKPMKSTSQEQNLD